jgi:ethanolamine utilization protein EutP
MKKLILMGRVAAGKTTLLQALSGEDLSYYKTQSIHYLENIIDTPGEYTERRETGGALALYAYEADVVGLVISANEPYSIYSPCITCMVNRDVIGIVTGVDKPDADPDLVESWLRLAGCKTVFRVSSYTGEGIGDILDYLAEEGDERVPAKAEREADNT